VGVKPTTALFILIFLNLKEGAVVVLTPTGRCH
jgi:hypothetical protein